MSKADIIKLNDFCKKFRINKLINPPPSVAIKATHRATTSRVFLIGCAYLIPAIFPELRLQKGIKLPQFHVMPGLSSPKTTRIHTHVPDLSNKVLKSLPDMVENV